MEFQRGDGVVIRAARACDHPAVLAVWRRAVEATHTFLTAADVDAIAAQVTGVLPQCVDLRVAELDERLVGFIAVDEEVVEMLFVAPEVHGRGVGSRLLEHATSGHGLTRVDVNEQNPSGRAFYRARGFRQVGRSPLDGEGRPFPILHLVRTDGVSADTGAW